LSGLVHTVKPRVQLDLTVIPYVTSTWFTAAHAQPAPDGAPRLPPTSCKLIHTLNIRRYAKPYLSVRQHAVLS